MVGTNSFVLVGKRPWQSDDKRECDLLCILQQKYGDFEEDGDGGGGDRAIVFTDTVDDETETDELIPKQSNKNATKDDEINFDDI
jgi:hypothetical protein